MKPPKKAKLQPVTITITSQRDLRKLHAFAAIYQFKPAEAARAAVRIHSQEALRVSRELAAC